MRKCTKCGQRFEDHINFCTRCGQALPPPKGYTAVNQPVVGIGVPPVQQQPYQQWQQPMPQPTTSMLEPVTSIPEPVTSESADKPAAVCNGIPPIGETELVDPTVVEIPTDFNPKDTQTREPEPYYPPEYSVDTLKTEKPKLYGHLEYKYHDWIYDLKGLKTMIIVIVVLMVIVSFGLKSFWPVIIGVIAIIVMCVRWFYIEAWNSADLLIGLGKRAKWRRQNRKKK